MTPNRPMDVDELIAEFLLAAERGDAPDPEDWLACHPDHASELAAFVADLGRFAAFLGLPHLSDTDLTADFTRLAAPGAPTESDGGGSFDGFELLEEIGRGGMGKVYRARLSGTTLVVALKQIHLRGQGEEEAARQLRKEIDSVAALRHPNIVPIYHVGDSRPYLHHGPGRGRQSG